MKKIIYLFLLLTILLFIFTACSDSSSVQPETIEIEKNDNKAESEKIYKIGIARWLDNSEFDKNIDGFKDGLAKVGLIEGENLIIEIRSANADKDKQESIIDEFISLEVDLIYSLTTPGTLIAKEKTSEIPIVFSIVTYPVETGVIDSLTSSNNNLVGTRNWIHISKQLELIRSIDSDIKKIGFVHREGEPNSVIQYEDMVKEASLYAVEVVDINPSELIYLEEMLLNNIRDLDLIYMANDTLVQDGEDIIVRLANENKIMTLSGNKSGLSKGALIGDVADIYSIGALSGQKASSILLQEKRPTDLVTESQRGSFVIVNLKTAHEIGVIIPDEILSRAKLVIE